MLASVSVPRKDSFVSTGYPLELPLVSTQNAAVLSDSTLFAKNKRLALLKCRSTGSPKAPRHWPTGVVLPCLDGEARSYFPFPALQLQPGTHTANEVS